MRIPLIAAGLYASPAAMACSLAGPNELDVDPTLADGVIPLQPLPGDVEIQRGRGPQPSGGLFGGGQMVSSCDDLGFVTVTLTQPGGDPQVGYRWEVVEGESPFGEDGATTSGDDPPELSPVTFSWIDEATDDQEALDFVIAFTPVDEGGEEGPPVEVRIEHPGSTETEESGGCGGDGWLCLAPAVLLVRRKGAR